MPNPTFLEDRIDETRERAFHLVVDEVERATKEHGERQLKSPYAWITLLVRYLGQVATAAPEYLTDPVAGRVKLANRATRVLAVGLLMLEQLLLEPVEKRPN